eukprot:6467404-Amphidinium_carterae.1
MESCRTPLLDLLEQRGLCAGDPGRECSRATVRTSSKLGHPNCLRVNAAYVGCCDRTYATERGTVNSQ